MWRLSKKQFALFIFSLFLLSALLFLLYLYTLKPMKDRIEQLESELKTEQTLLKTIQAKQNEQNDERLLSVVELQKRVPVQPFFEQFLLEIEKAEVVSNSLVSNMTFSDGEGVTGAPNEQQEQSAQANDSEQSPSSSLPSGIKKLSVDLTVRSPSYYQLERFIETLEHAKRIIAVESLSFTGQPELTSLTDEIQPLTYSLTVSTFYAPDLKELKKQLPPIDVPSPSQKRNPFPSLIEE
ncbi:pilus assembly protein PilO [Thermolongibacillus altinsuensis]|uniref:pilus assembly protein PilO n=1 Tax=Thermolongibacillus altinsuensis TaxID=575256 RepID=UPI00242A2D65|nr:pilus assembly protein PilO [Thermolongibacillus altinsuensis]GMB07468.1 hypothetical protein B1no1_01780 [Thermolongibacillus altinsuensis]